MTTVVSYHWQLKTAVKLGTKVLTSNRLVFMHH